MIGKFGRQNIELCELCRFVENSLKFLIKNAKFFPCKNTEALTKLFWCKVGKTIFDYFKGGPLLLDILERLNKGRLKAFRVDKLLIHPQLDYHLIEMERAGHQMESDIPRLKSNDGRESSLELRALTMSFSIFVPLVCCCVEKNYYVVSGFSYAAQCRLDLRDSDKVMAIFLSALTDDEIDLLLIINKLILPVSDRCINASRRSEIWEIKKYFESAGLLEKIGLAEISKTVWANSLKCYPRDLT